MKQAPALLCATLFLAYALGGGSTICFGDCGIYVAQACLGFTLENNATAHFLYVNFYHLLHLALPWVPAHLLMTVGNALWGALAVWQLHALLLHRGMGARAALLLAACLGLAFTWLKQVTTAEVYALYFLALLLVLRLLWQARPSAAQPYLLALALGTLAWLHVQSLALAPACWWWLWQVQRRPAASLVAPGLLLLALVGSLALLPLATGASWAWYWVFWEPSQRIHPYNPAWWVPLRTAALGLAYALICFWPVPFLFRYAKRGRPTLAIRIFWWAALGPYVLFAILHDVNDNYVFHLGWYFLALLALGPHLQLRPWATRLAPAAVVAGLLLASVALPLAGYRVLLGSGMAQGLHASRAFKGGLYYLCTWWLADKQDLMHNSELVRQAPPSRQAALADSLQLPQWDWQYRQYLLYVECRGE